MIGSTPIFSVSDFVAVFNQSLDVLYPEVTIVGELSSFRISKNMWTYFDLKDDIASVKFFGSVRVLPGPLEDGMMVEVVGRPYLHPQFGFSVQMQAIQPIGDGSINKAYMLLVKKLEQDGLFDDNRKRSLPYAPEKVGVITSRESAAYGDFKKIINSRWPALAMELFNVAVQGKDAPQQVARAIDDANQKSGDNEVLVIIRGGGSKDDLEAFDDERVVRAIAGSRIPTLVAIGHERDVALSERAADMRASTPSNAAEILVPDKAQELAVIKVITTQLDNEVMKFSEAIRSEADVLRGSINQSLAGKWAELNQATDYTRKLLQAFDPRQPLSRGYVLPRTSSGTLIKNSKDAKKAGTFNLEFKDDTIGVEVLKI